MIMIIKFLFHIMIFALNKEKQNLPTWKAEEEIGLK